LPFNRVSTRRFRQLGDRRAENPLLCPARQGTAWKEKVARILAGSNEASIAEFRSLSTYGLLSDYSIPAIVGMINHLIDEGYIERAEGYRTHHSSQHQGRVFLKERTPLSIPGV
jgi:hypothetical protein